MQETLKNPETLIMENNKFVSKKHNCVNRKDKWIDVASQAYEAASKRKYYAAEEKKFLVELKDLSEMKNSAGGGYMLISMKRPGTVDYSKIDILKSMDLDQYRKEAVLSWKLSKV